MRHYAFLRAINTGERRVTNEELLAPFHALGYAEVAAYQAAGNVTFVADRSAEQIEDELADTLGAAYGFDAPAFVRSSGEMASIVATCPFTPDQIAATEGRIQITFLADPADAAANRDVLAAVPADDRVVVAGREWWWLPRAGVSTSQLAVRSIEERLGPMTMRTLGTIERMLAKFG